MYSFKLIGLALSLLLQFNPVNYDWDIWQYPQTRTVSAHWSTDFTIQDIGYADSPVGVSNTIEEENAQHYYVISYVFTIDCSESCYVASTDNAYQISDTSFQISAKQAQTYTPAEMFAARNFTQNGTVTNSLTFASASDAQRIQLQMPMMNNVSVSIWVYFKGYSEGVVLDDIANHVLNASSYLLRLTLNNQNIPNSVMTQYRQYIDNGDYSTAYNYITNYIDQRQITENQNTNTEVNNYQTKYTDLNTYFTTENNFANQVETDFTNQQQNIPLSDTTLNFSNQYFIKSAEWVSLRFNNLFDNTPFGKLLIFSLITGFILALIGRFKR